MYLKWSQNKKYKYELISEHKGDEAGIKSSTIKINGNFIYGLLKSESGIHRLVRISPFDSGARRHTSFASVWVYPVVDENIKIDILDKDLRIDTYRSSGAGGQHVNTTDSAVRITHKPSKIVVQCQNERSQHKNKETCLNMLKARLYEFEIQKKEKENEKTQNSKSEIGWGHQIRSYVLHPYRLVKDNRTNFETSDPEKVLNGEIDNFLEKSLYKLNDKKINKIFIYLTLILALIIFYLSMFGITTNRFNNLINNQINNYNKNININFKDPSFLINLVNFSLKIEIENPIVNFNNHKLNLDKINLNLKLKSLIFDET